MPDIMLEDDIEEKFVIEAKKLRCSSIKMNITGRRSMPDRLIILAYGGVIWIEFKRPKQKVRPAQAHIHRALHSKRQICETFDDAANAFSFLKACLESARVSGGRGPTFADPSVYGPTYGSRLREDIYDAHGFETPEALRCQQEDARGCSAESLLLGMAERSREVGEFYGNQSEHTARFIEGSEP